MATAIFFLAFCLVGCTVGEEPIVEPFFNISMIEPRADYDRSAGGYEIEPRRQRLSCGNEIINGVGDKTPADPFVYKPAYLFCVAHLRVERNTRVSVVVKDYVTNSANTIRFYWRRTTSSSYKRLSTGNGRSFSLSPLSYRYILTIYFYGSDDRDIDGFEVDIFSGNSGPSSSTSTTTTRRPNTDSGSYCSQCGLRLDRIVGGVNAGRYEIPWQVGIRTNFGSTFCGGTLITPLHVLTAAHCVTNVSRRNLRVVLGDHNRNQNDSGERTVSVASVKIHEAYNTRTLVNDIAILKLSTSISMSRSINVACIPSSSARAVSQGDQVIASGWGATSHEGSASNTLKKVTMPALSVSKCQSAYRGASVTNKHLCAGLDKGGKDTCQGDSGGPLIFKAGSRSIVVGVTSWGSGCAKPNSPGVYTRVRSFQRWIEQNTSGSETCTRTY